MLKSWIYTCLAVLGFLAAWWLVERHLISYVAPFLTGAILGELLHPLVTRMARWRRVTRGIAAGLLVTATVAVLALTVTLTTAAVVTQVGRIAASAPDMYAWGVDLQHQLALRLGAWHATLPPSVQDVVAQAPEKLTAWLEANTGSMLNALQSLATVPKQVLGLLIALIAAFFYCRDRAEVHTFLLGLFPAGARESVRAAVRQMWASVLAFGVAQLLIALVTAVLCGVGLLVVGAPDALGMAVLIGVAGIVPVVGLGLVFVPWVGYHLAFGSTALAMKLLVVFAVVTVVRSALEPKIIGERVGLHPLLILLSLYVGVEVFGAAGVFTGPFVALGVKSLFKSGVLPVRLPAANQPLPR